MADVIDQYVQCRVRSGEKLADVLADIGDELSPEKLGALRRQLWLAAVMRGGVSKTDRAPDELSA